MTSRDTPGPTSRPRLRRWVAAIVLLIAASMGTGVLIGQRDAAVEPTAAGAMHPAATPTAQAVGPLRIEATISPDPPRQKGNTVRLVVRDDEGQPIEGADVTVEYSMPAMGAMPEMRGEARVTPEGRGSYRADFDLVMGGTWTLEVTVAAPEGTGSARWTFTVGASGLTPVGRPTGAQPGAGEVFLDEGRRQQFGIRTEPVTRERLTDEIRATGRVAYDEARLTDVNLKFDGWVRRLHVAATGEEVRRGQPLLTIYSPELFAAQQEYLLAVRSQQRARATGAPDRADYLVRAAQERLRLWDLSKAQIAEIARRGAPVEAVPILAPVSGWVVEKEVVAGAAVKAGDRLFRIADLERVWVEAEVHEADLPRLRVGQSAEVALTHVPDRSYEAQITHVLPEVDETTRTGRVRLELANEGGELRPDMYATVRVSLDEGERLTVPASAVVYSGPRRIVFVDLGEGRLRPQEVKLGVRAGDRYEIVEGLREGEVVVASGNFLVDSESRLRSALEHWDGAE